MSDSASRRCVSFNIPKTLVIHDQILRIRKTIPFYENLSLYMLPRFHFSPSQCETRSPPTAGIKVKSRLNNQTVDIFLPLGAQGIYPGDILEVYR
jgi:hypothetical protein